MDFLLSDYVRRLRSNKNQLYRDLKPKDRIIKIVQTNILPGISHLGFKFVKSNMKLERNVGEFRQCIWFRTNRKNFRDDIVEFAIHLKVESDSYSSFVRETIDSSYTDSTFITASAEYLEEWDKDFMKYWYALQLDDNLKIVDAIIKNIVSTTSTFLDENSNFEKSLEYRLRKFTGLDYFGLLWIPDILILSKFLDRKDVQSDILDRYKRWTQTEEAKKDIEEGVEIYGYIENIAAKL